MVVLIDIGFVRRILSNPRGPEKHFPTNMIQNCFNFPSHDRASVATLLLRKSTRFQDKKH